MTGEAQQERGKQALERIRENNARDGHRIYVVGSEEERGFAYAIGVSESVGVELILAVAVYYIDS
jgi:hypothetical protein